MTARPDHWHTRIVGSLSRLTKDRRITGTGSLASASLSSALIVIVTLPIVTRLYTPDQYAGYALGLAISSLLGTVISGRYEMVCVVAARNETGDREAWKVARLALLTATTGTCAIQIGVVLAVIIGVGNASSYLPLTLLLVPLLALLSAISTIQTLLDTRLGNYHLISGITAIRALMLAGLQITLGLLDASAATLLISLLLSFTPSVIRLTYLLVRRSPGREPRTLLQLASIHRRYPKFQIWAALANGLSFNLFILALAVAYGELTVGIFAVASRLILFPKSLVTGPVNTVYFQEAAKLAHKPEAGLRLYQRVTLTLSVCGIAIFAIIALITPFLVRALGQDWLSAEPLIYASIPMALALFIGAPANSSLIVHDRQAALLAWRIFLVGLGPALIMLGPTMDYPDSIAVGLASVGLLLGTVVYAIWATRVFRL